MKYTVKFGLRNDFYEVNTIKVSSYKFALKLARKMVLAFTAGNVSCTEFSKKREQVLDQACWSNDSHFVAISKHEILFPKLHTSSKEYPALTFKTPYEEHPERFLVFSSALPANYSNYFARLLVSGDRYGKRGAKIYKGKIPLVEFYDKRQDQNAWLGIKGQLIKRHVAQVLFLYNDPATGLSLDDIPGRHVLGGPEMQTVKKWLLQTIKFKSKPFYYEHPERFLAINSPQFPKCLLVRRVLKGERYGEGGKLINQHEEPVVEFYDQNSTKNCWLGTNGQFIGRYKISFLVGLDEPEGLPLDGTLAKWTLSPSWIQSILTWVFSQNAQTREWVKG